MSVVRAAGLLVYRLFNDEIQYLMLRTSYGERHWTPPKGHVDPGENAREAAVRETTEEAGLKADDYEIDEAFEWKLNYEVKGRPKEVIYWLARLKDPGTQIKLSVEHTEYRWCVEATACELTPCYKDMQEMLHMAQRHLEKK